jgi:hypothetical protein
VRRRADGTVHAQTFLGGCLELSDSSAKLVGPSGSILLPDDDEITRILAMLFEGQCFHHSISFGCFGQGLSRPGVSCGFRISVRTGDDSRPKTQNLLARATSDQSDNQNDHGNYQK